MKFDNRPIGVFDSGVGGISVLHCLTRLMPNENFIYYGDSINAPYGTKTFDEVKRLTFATAKKLIDQNCKCLVIACNTATAAAVKSLRQEYDLIPVIGIEPALKPAVIAKPGGRILVMATAVTLKEEKFHHLMDTYKDCADIFTLPCPGIVEFVEKGIISGNELNLYLMDLLHNYIANPPDAIVLGCTHYPFVRESIRSIFNQNILIFDGGEGTARETLHQLKLHNICAGPDSKGSVVFENSNPKMLDLCDILLKKARKLC